MGRSLFWHKVVYFCICINTICSFFFLTYECFSEFLNFLSCVNERHLFLKKELSNDSDIPRLFKWMILTK